MSSDYERGAGTKDARSDGDFRVLEERMRQMRRDIDDNDKRIKALAEERVSLFRWGAIAMGSVVVAIGTWAVSIVMGGHVK